MLKVGGAEKHYSSLVFVPRAVDENNDGKDDNNGKFHTYDADDGYWFFSNGDTAKATGCTQADACTFQDAVAGLAAPQEFQNNGQTVSVESLDDATIHSVGVGKGRDSQFHGAVDALRLGDKVYDFEARGVFKRDAS